MWCVTVSKAENFATVAHLLCLFVDQEGVCLGEIAETNITGPNSDRASDRSCQVAFAVTAKTGECLVLWRNTPSTGETIYRRPARALRRYSQFTSHCLPAYPQARARPERGRPRFAEFAGRINAGMVEIAFRPSGPSRPSLSGANRHRPRSARCGRSGSGRGEPAPRGAPLFNPMQPTAQLHYLGVRFCFGLRLAVQGFRPELGEHAD